jgi:hypothetical protein
LIVLTIGLKGGSGFLLLLPLPASMSIGTNQFHQKKDEEDSLNPHQQEFSLSLFDSHKQFFPSLHEKKGRERRGIMIMIVGTRSFSSGSFPFIGAMNTSTS